jgi:hypothetical protein
MDDIRSYHVKLKIVMEMYLCLCRYVARGGLFHVKERRAEVIRIVINLIEERGAISSVVQQTHGDVLPCHDSFLEHFDLSLIGAGTW